MKSSKTIGVLVAVAGFLVLSAAAVFSPLSGNFFAGLMGIQQKSADVAVYKLAQIPGMDASVAVAGRDAIVTVNQYQSGDATVAENQVVEAINGVGSIRNVKVNFAENAAKALGDGGASNTNAPESQSAEAQSSSTAAGNSSEGAIPEGSDGSEVPGSASALNVDEAPGSDGKVPLGDQFEDLDAQPEEPQIPEEMSESLALALASAQALGAIDMSLLGFQQASAEFIPGAESVIDQIADGLNENVGSNVRVTAYAEAVDPEVSLSLAVRRADKIVEELIARGVEEDRLFSEGVALTDPDLGDNGSERVEFLIMERTQQ